MRQLRAIGGDRRPVRQLHRHIGAGLQPAGPALDSGRHRLGLLDLHLAWPQRARLQAHSRRSRSRTSLRRLLIACCSPRSRRSGFVARGSSLSAAAGSSGVRAEASLIAPPIAPPRSPRGIPPPPNPPIPGIIEPMAPGKPDSAPIAGPASPPRPPINGSDASPPSSGSLANAGSPPPASLVQARLNLLCRLLFGCSAPRGGVRRSGTRAGGVLHRVVTL